MKKLVRLTERDLNKLIKRIVNEDMESSLGSTGGKWLSVKNRIPANPPKMSIGAFSERLCNDGICNMNTEEPLADAKIFVWGPTQPGDNRPSKLLVLDPLDKKWIELTR